MTNWRPIVFWTSLALVVVLIFQLLGITLLPFLTGVSLAILLEPMVRRMNRRGWSRTLVCAIVAVLGFTVIGGVVATIGPFFLKEGRAFVDSLPQILAALNDRLQPIYDRFGIEGHAVNINSLIPHGQNLGRNVLHITLGALNATILIIITPFVAFFLMRDWPQIRMGIRDLLPKASKTRTLQIGRDVTHQLNRWVRGQLILCAVLATYYAFTLTLIGLKYAIFIGVVTGFIVVIPVLGSLTMFIVSLLVALTQSEGLTLVAMVMMTFGFAVLMETILLQPLLVGRSIRMHPVLVLLAVLVGGKLFGFMGALLSLPAVAVSHVFFKHMAQLYKKSQFYEHA